MKIINPNCLCRNCMYQLECKEHILAIKVRNLLPNIAGDFVTVLFRIENCSKFRLYNLND